MVLVDVLLLSPRVTPASKPTYTNKNKLERRAKEGTKAKFANHYFLLIVEQEQVVDESEGSIGHRTTN